MKLICGMSFLFKIDKDTKEWKPNYDKKVIQNNVLILLDIV